MYSSIFNVFFKRNAAMVATVFTGAFVFQAYFDLAVTNWYENRNKGKLWKDVKLTLGGGDDDGDDDDDDGYTLFPRRYSLPSRVTQSNRTLSRWVLSRSASGSICLSASSSCNSSGNSKISSSLRPRFSANANGPITYGSRLIFSSWSSVMWRFVSNSEFLIVYTTPSRLVLESYLSVNTSNFEIGTTWSYACSATKYSLPCGSREMSEKKYDK
ncbi:hypothetical protein OGAPHI_005433 [Ogataea philodendri]|uniref:Complex III subunit 9 n=1 Tax=Ogataea philodendri TaxID=1378263 RepID=A0A9P8NZ62_9ASCO|nr:uncharacterized protein OGAPHI_005433 [Ogataea philodendri]KAH3662185.1 hypothetical protein OGAPHI_005433 [Ogataea philodendri]